MAWYKTWFDQDEHDLLYKSRDQSEADKTVDLILRTIDLPANARILDMGCGRGRHALSFAKKGYRVTGVDLSERSLAIARRSAAKADVNIDFERGDMRTWTSDRRFDLVANLFTAFGYFERDEDHQAAVHTMAAALASDGWLVQDFINGIRIRKTLVPQDRRSEDGWDIRISRRLDDDRLIKNIAMSRDGVRREFHESVHLLSLSDFERMYAVEGLAVQHLMGSYDGSTFTDESPRMILFAARNPDSR